MPNYQLMMIRIRRPWPFNRCCNHINRLAQQFRRLGQTDQPLNQRPVA